MLDVGGLPFPGTRSIDYLVVCRLAPVTRHADLAEHQAVLLAVAVEAVLGHAPADPDLLFLSRQLLDVAEVSSMAYEVTLVV
jgi:hypothetical protein